MVQEKLAEVVSQLQVAKGLPMEEVDQVKLTKAWQTWRGFLGSGKCSLSLQVKKPLCQMLQALWGWFQKKDVSEIKKSPSCRRPW